jgi:hypothetical protein
MSCTMSFVYTIVYMQRRSCERITFRITNPALGKHEGGDNGDDNGDDDDDVGDGTENENGKREKRGCWGRPHAIGNVMK